VCDLVDLRLPRVDARVGDFAFSVVPETALVTVWIAFEMVLVGDDAGEEDDLAGVPRVERGVGEVGSGN
jgi:hypothetical protein